MPSPSGPAPTGFARKFLSSRHQRALLQNARQSVRFPACDCRNCYRAFACVPCDTANGKVLELVRDDEINTVITSTVEQKKRERERDFNKTRPRYCLGYILFLKSSALLFLFFFFSRETGERRLIKPRRLAGDIHSVSLAARGIRSSGESATLTTEREREGGRGSDEVSWVPQMEESGVSQPVNNPSPWKCRGIACLRPLTRLIARSLIPISRGASDPFLNRPRFAVIPAATSEPLPSSLKERASPVIRSRNFRRGSRFRSRNTSRRRRDCRGDSPTLSNSSIRV